MTEKLEDYHKRGLLYKQSHRKLPLVIWNYTERVQYESLWDETTLMCRGLITDADGKVVVKPMNKFFNYEEVADKALIPWDDQYVYVQDKEDGSMLILFHYAGEWVTATRGSFSSDQAIKGLEILRKRYDLEWFNKSVAYIGEVIYPENRIVVDHGSEEKVVFLTAVPNNAVSEETETHELNWTTAKAFFHSSGIKEEDIVSTEQHNIFGEGLIKSLKEMNAKNKEGFVLRFFPSNYRVKVKFEDYIRLHRIITCVSNVSIWECLKDSKPLDDILVDVPDEFYGWVKKTETKLNYQYACLAREYKNIMILIKSIDEVKDRKTFAYYAKRYKHSAILFRMLDGKPYADLIWNAIRPKFSKPFFEK